MLFRSGQIQVVFADVSLVRAHIASGKLKGLATTGANRLSDQPELPTVAESGVPGYAAGTWYGLFAPAGLPAEVLRTLNRAANEILAQPDTRNRLLAMGTEPTGGSPEQLAQTLRQDDVRWASVVAANGLRTE